MKKISFFLILILLIFSCKKENVKITKKASYTEVKIDYSFGTRFDIGKEYGQKSLKIIPEFEKIGDSYINDLVNRFSKIEKGRFYQSLLDRSAEIRIHIEKEYADEIEGFASVLSGKNKNIQGDNKLSVDEFWLLNLITDITFTNACSAIGVWDNKSDTGQTILGRNTDWFAGNSGQLSKLNAVIYTKLNRRKEIIAVGYIGQLGYITALNSDELWLSILFSITGNDHPGKEKRSLAFDLRKAAENEKNMDGAWKFFCDPAKIYNNDHLIFLATDNECKVLENDQKNKRVLREDGSLLNKGISWDFKDAIVAVNSFVLFGNTDNHTKIPQNYLRWNNFRKELALRPDMIGYEGMKSIITFHKPGAIGRDHGDVFNEATLQSAVYSFNDNKLFLYLHPSSRSFDDNPEFIEVAIPFLEDK